LGTAAVLAYGSACGETGGAMAKPRVFVSSTFYDLKQVRSDLEHFIRELGYESVLNEHGNIPYGNQERLEQYCYKEIELVDILVSIIGGRFGSNAGESSYSISQMELKTTLKLGKQVYVLIEKAVYSEFETYLHNKNVEGIKYRHVDTPNIYMFIEEARALPVNNTIASF
jgi:hypothetical protein